VTSLHWYIFVALVVHWCDLVLLYIPKESLVRELRKELLPQLAKELASVTGNG
jgi:hypothetical protein